MKEDRMAIITNFSKEELQSLIERLKNAEKKKREDETPLGEK